jgi:hypothetical protein
MKGEGRRMNKMVDLECGDASPLLKRGRVHAFQRRIIKLNNNTKSNNFKSGLD